MEEAKALVSWEAIKDHLRNEDHNRNNEENVSATPLDSLSAEQLVYVREKYEKLTPYIRISFVLMTVLALIWDVMLMVRISPLFGMERLKKYVCIIFFHPRQLSFISIQPRKNLLRE